MITELGKQLRKIRIDNEETLKIMASYLNVSSSFLSAVETGYKKAPQKWVQLLSQKYQLNKEQIEELQRNINDAVPNVKISLRNTNNTKRKVALSFSRSFISMTDQEAKQIMAILNSVKQKQI